MLLEDYEGLIARRCLIKELVTLGNFKSALPLFLRWKLLPYHAGIEINLLTLAARQNFTDVDVKY